MPRRDALLYREHLPHGHASTFPACPTCTAPRPLLRYVPWILTREDTPPTFVWDARLGGYGSCRSLVGHLPTLSRLPLTAWSTDKAAAEEIEARTPKHLALQHLQAIDVVRSKYSN